MKVPSLFFLAFVSAAGATEFRADVEYAAPTNGTARMLDLHVPDGTGPFPVVVYVHGGGWASGDKTEAAMFTNLMAGLPAVLVSVNYRLAPTNRWPACLDDVQAALRWVKTNAPTFKGDPQRVALMGYSAGGHLACHAAVLAGDDTRVQAVVGLAAPTDNLADSERRGGLSKSMQMLNDLPEALDATSRARLRDLSPLNYIKPGLPPFFLAGGTEDKSVPYSQSVNLQARLAAANVACELITITNAGHRISEWEPLHPGWQEKLAAWLKATLSP
jgi:acetyl esterase/lipase